MVMRLIYKDIYLALLKKKKKGRRISVFDLLEKTGRKCLEKKKIMCYSRDNTTKSSLTNVIINMVMFNYIAFYFKHCNRSWHCKNRFSSSPFLSHLKEKHKKKVSLKCLLCHQLIKTPKFEVIKKIFNKFSL